MSGRPARRAPLGAYLAGLTVLLLAVLVASLGVGATGLPWHQVVEAVRGAGSTPEHALVYEVRVPRAVLAALVGANLAVAGLLAQTLTRNPLASPQTFGINAGAAVAIVVATIAFPALAGLGTAAAFLGAGGVGLVMWWLSTAGAVTTVGLALAGMTIQIMLLAVVQGILIMNNAAADIVFWLAGSVTGALWADVQLVLPFSVAGLAIALTGARHFGVLALDTTAGQALGAHPRRIAGVAALAIMLLAGSAVAVAGPIGFIGLIVPHLTRRLVGAGFGRCLLLCLVGGALLLPAADLLARLLAFPQEIPVGIVTAAIGAPAFLWLAIKHRVRR